MNWGPSDPQPSTCPLSYRAIDINDVKIDFYISPQTMDQYWSTLVFEGIYLRMDYILVKILFTLGAILGGFEQILFQTIWSHCLLC